MSDAHLDLGYGTPVSTPSVDVDFAEWYRLYPRKVAPEAARRAYRAARKRGGNREQLLDGLRRYISSVSSKDRQYIAHPATWLNGSRWLDEIGEETGVNAEPWAQRVSMFRDKRIWLSTSWGPEPGHPECRVPKRFL